MRLKEYLAMMGALIEKAEDSNNYEECIRLSALLVVVAEDYMKKANTQLEKVSKTPDSET